MSRHPAARTASPASCPFRSLLLAGLLWQADARAQEGGATVPAASTCDDEPDLPCQVRLTLTDGTEIEGTLSGEDDEYWWLLRGEKAPAPYLRSEVVAITELGPLQPPPAAPVSAGTVRGLIRSEGGGQYSIDQYAYDKRDIVGILSESRGSVSYIRARNRNLWDYSTRWT